MYSYEDRIRAVKFYINCGYNAAYTVSKLGYLDASNLKHWYREYSEFNDLHYGRKKVSKFSDKEKREAVDYYFAHGRNALQTVNALRYPSRPLLVQWVVELYPEEGERRCKSFKAPVRCSQEEKIQAVMESCKGNLKITILKEFRELMKEAFDAEIFADSSDMVEKVNAWVNDKTKGMIPKLLDQAPADLRAVLMNAISFEAKWETIYEEDDVEEESEFTNYDGSISEVTMLHSDEEDYIEDDFYTGFVKNYKGGKYAFMALLPKKKKAKTFWKRAIEQTNFKAYYDSRSYAEVVARIPEFEIATDMELTGFCQSIGIKSIFNPDADFSGMTVHEPLMVSSVLQKAAIKVDRAGTKATAVSAMYVVAGCAPDFDGIKYVDLDRPFVYAVVDRESGLPVFSGVVNKL